MSQIIKSLGYLSLKKLIGSQYEVILIQKLMRYADHQKFYVSE